MSEPWEAQFALDALTAASIIGDQFPDLAPARVEPLSWGFDNTAFLVNGEWVFRFPRRPIAVPLMEQEIRILPSIAPRLPVALPVPRCVGRPEERFQHPFAGYRLLPGTTACRARLTAEQHALLAEPLGRFLATLHALPVNEAERLGVGGDSIGRLDVPMRSRKARAAMTELIELGLLNESERARLDRIIDSTPAVESMKRVLLHGDLYSRHLMVDGEAQLTGVIDWGDLHIGHPAADLHVAWLFLPASAHDRFRQAYGSIDDTTWMLARFRALSHTVAVARFAHLISDAELSREARWSLDRLLAASG